MVLGYPSQPKTYMMRTPNRRRSVKRIVRRSYPLLFADIVRTSSLHRNLMIGALARQARKEMKAISFSALFRNKKALANFSWTTVWDEIVKEAPVLTNLLSSLVTKPEENKAILCMVANMFLKKHNNRWHWFRNAFLFFYMEMGAVSR